MKLTFENESLQSLSIDLLLVKEYTSNIQLHNLYKELKW